MTNYNFDGRLAGSARIPLIHFDIVEYQMPDRVMRQYGYLQGIPSPTEDHSELRKAKELFDVDDSMALRRSYIGHWHLYMDHFQGQILEASEKIPIETYMKWYKRITRRRIHRPRPEGDRDPSYEPRSVYDQHHLINMVESAKSILDKYAAVNMPPEFYLMKEGWDQLYAIYDSDVRGHKEEAQPSTEIPTTLVTDLTDVYIPTTQDTEAPDVYISTTSVDFFRTETEVAEASQPQPSYADKGAPNKFLREYKVHWINENLFTTAPVNPDIFPISHPQQAYVLHHQDLLSLSPGSWLYEHVMDAYMSLLRIREEKYRNLGIRRWARFGFMPSFFMHLGRGFAPITDENRAHYFCKSYVEPPVGPPLHMCDYIFMPLCVPGRNHFILLVLAVEKWKILLLDPLYNDTPYITLTEMYKEYIDVATQLLPFTLRVSNPMGNCPKKAPTINTLVQRPKQKNTSDCGIFVCKYVDYYVRGDIDVRQEKWSEADIFVFRYRICHELYKGQARDLPSSLLS